MFKKNIFNPLLYSKEEGEDRVEYKVLGIKIKKRKKDKCIAVIKLNGLGDYILMHNFLPYIKQSEKYKNYKLIVIAWSHFSSLINSIDSSYVDEFIWINSTTNKSWEIKYLKKKFSQYEFDTILSPVVSDFEIAEKILSTIKAKNIIGQECLMGKNHSKNKKLYTKLIKSSQELITEFDRIKCFFEKVLDLKIDIEKPSFEYCFDSDEKYIFFSPFAGNPKRTWHKENFAKIINYVIERYNYKCAILGSKFDIKKALELISMIKPQNLDFVVNATGKIATCDLPRILKRNTKLLIANETGTVHVAAAINCPFLVISNASFYKRFQPYKGFEESYIYPPKFRELLNSNKNVDYYYAETDLDINDITTKDLITKLDNILKN